MKLWRVLFYNYLGELVNSWYYSRRAAATEHGEEWAAAFDFSYDVKYAGSHKYTINACDPGVVSPFDAKTWDDETVFFDSYEDFKKVNAELGGRYKIRG